MERETQNRSLSKPKEAAIRTVLAGIAITSAFFDVNEGHEDKRGDNSESSIISREIENPNSEEKLLLVLEHKEENFEQATPTPAPTPEPTPEPTVAPVQVQLAIPEPSEIPQLSAEGLKDLICAYPWPCEEALRIKWCESGDSWDEIGKGGYGGFQINPVHIARFPDFWQSWTDPVKNTSWAYEIWSEQGWKPWGCRP